MQSVFFTLKTNSIGKSAECPGKVAVTLTQIVVDKPAIGLG